MFAPKCKLPKNKMGALPKNTRNTVQKQTQKIKECDFFANEIIRKQIIEQPAGNKVNSNRKQIHKIASMRTIQSTYQNGSNQNSMRQKISKWHTNRYNKQATKFASNQIQLASERSRNSMRRKTSENIEENQQFNQIEMKQFYSKIQFQLSQVLEIVRKQTKQVNKQISQMRNIINDRKKQKQNKNKKSIIYTNNMTDCGVQTENHQNKQNIEQNTTRVRHYTFHESFDGNLQQEDINNDNQKQMSPSTQTNNQAIKQTENLHIQQNQEQLISDLKKLGVFQKFSIWFKQSQQPRSQISQMTDQNKIQHNKKLIQVLLTKQ